MLRQAGRRTSCISELGDAHRPTARVPFAALKIVPKHRGSRQVQRIVSVRCGLKCPRACRSQRLQQHLSRQQARHGFDSRESPRSPAETIHAAHHQIERLNPCSTVLMRVMLSASLSVAGLTPVCPPASRAAVMRAVLGSCRLRKAWIRSTTSPVGTPNEDTIVASITSISATNSTALAGKENASHPPAG